MKLAEALNQRADLQRRIAQLRERLFNNVKVQEGDQPAEKPEDLFRELEAALKQLKDMIVSINRTNQETVWEGKTLTEIIAEKDVLSMHLAALRSRQASVEDLEEACRAAENKLQKEQDAILHLEKSAKDIQTALEKKASAHSPGGIMDQYSLLLGAQEAAAAEEERLLSFFPEKIPSADDPPLDELIRSRPEKEMTSARLTEVRSALHQRQDALKELDSALASLEKAFPDLLPQEQFGTEEVPEGTSGPGIWLLVAGMAMLAASFIFLGQIRRNYLIALAVAGLVTSGIGSLMMVRLLQIRRRIRSVS